MHTTGIKRWKCSLVCTPCILGWAFQLWPWYVTAYHFLLSRRLYRTPTFSCALPLACLVDLPVSLFFICLLFFFSFLSFLFFYFRFFLSFIFFSFLFFSFLSFFSFLFFYFFTPVFRPVRGGLSHVFLPHGKCAVAASLFAVARLHGHLLVRRALWHGEHVNICLPNSWFFFSGVWWLARTAENWNRVVLENYKVKTTPWQASLLLMPLLQRITSKKCCHNTCSKLTTSHSPTPRHQVLLGIVSKTTMQGCGYNAQAPTFTTSNKDTNPADYYDDIYLGCVLLLLK